MAPAVPDAYRECRALARSHYENFPVASYLLPPRMRDPVAAIYVFARRADDLADEGDADDATRLAALDAMAEDLEATASGRPPDTALWRALGDAIPRFGLTLTPFHDLLDAFRQDVTQTRFDTFDDLRDYARRSADPVGHLLLQLADQATPENIVDANRICTGLQLINFLQDLHQDFIERDRLYIPQTDLATFGVTENDLRRGAGNADIDALLTRQIERAAAWLYAGRRLPRRLPGRFGLEIRLIVRGGWRIVERLRVEKPGMPFARPRLRPRDHGWIARGLLPGPILGAARPPRTDTE
ncbi:MAG: squalene synthase HpnC [Halofilum sp. (in: g-proteobacteria)]